MNKAASVLIYAGLGIVVILAAGALFVQTAYFKSWLRTFITGTINNEIQGRLLIDRVGGSLFTGIALSGITITSEGSAVITADEVRVSYYLPAMLTKTLDVPRVRIVRPRVTFRQAADGIWNFQKAFAGRRKPTGIAPTRSPLAGWSLRAGKVDLVDGTASLTDRRGKTVLGVPSLSLSSRGVLRVERKTLEGTIDLGSLRVEVKEPVALPVALRGEGSFEKGLIRIKYLDLAFGNSRGRVTATLKGAAPFIDGHAEFPVVSFDDVRRIAPSIPFPGAAALAVEFRGKPASFAAGCRFSYEDLNVESSGTVDFPRLRIAGISRIRHLHPETISRLSASAKKPPAPPGDVNLDVTFNVDGNPFEAGSGTGTVTLLPSSFSGIAASTTTLDITATSGIAALRVDDFATSAGTFSIRGEADVSGLVKTGGPVTGAVFVEARHVDLARVVRSDAAESDLNLSVSVDVRRTAGASKGMDLTGTFHASTSTVRGVTFSEISAAFALEAGTMNVRSLSVVSDVLRLSASGTVAPQGGLNVSYSLGVSDIGVIARWLPGIKAAGAFASTGTIGGTAANPAFSGVVTGEDLSYQGVAANNLRLEANVTGGGGENRLPSGTVRLAAGELRAGGTRAKTLTVQVAGDGEREAFSVNFQKDDARSLRVSGDAAFTGTNRVHVLLTTFGITAGTVTWSNTRPAQVVVSSGGVAVDSFVIAYASQSLSVSGGYRSKGDIRLDLVARDIDLGTVAGAAGLPVSLAGVMQSSFTVRGRTAFPEVNGALFVSTGAVGGVPFERMASTVTYSGGDTRLRFSLVRAGSEVLAATGTVRENGSVLEAYLAARDLDLAILSVLTPAVEQATGRLSASFAVSGSIREPKISGEAGLSGGTLRIRGAETTYRDLQVRMRITGDTLFIDRLSIKSDPGDASVRGSVALKGMMPENASIDIAVRRFKAMDARIFSGLVDADLRLRPQGNGTLLDGTFTVDEGLATIPKLSAPPSAAVTVIETGAGGKPKVVKAPGQAAAPFVDRLSLHVDVEVPGNLRVQGEGLNAELEGKLLVARNAGEPVTLSGNVSTVRGSYQFRGKLLMIDSAKVSFTGEPSLNPELNAQASTIVENITIYVNARGTLQQPRITITSDPPHDESDLIAYLVFGRPLSKLNQSENQMVQKAAVQALGGLAVAGVRDLLGENLAPDILNVYSGPESGFSVGKYITNRLFVRYEWRFGLEEIRQTILNFQLNRHFVLNSQVGSEQTSGLDLIWTTTY